MKKTIAWILLACLLLTGCGKTEPSLQETLGQPEDIRTEEPVEAPVEEPAEEPVGEMELYNAGNVTVPVPAGWKAFPDLDVFAEEEGAMDPDILNVSKGGTSDLDLLTKPYVRVNYFGPDITMMKPDSSWYDNPADIESFTAGDHVWYGFTCESLGAPLTILWCEEGDVQYQVTISRCSGADAISHTDADVQAILAGIVPSDPDAAVSEAPTEPEEVVWEDDDVQTSGFWNGDWYGWWCIRYASGAYEPMNDVAWDAYARIEDYGDGSGYLTLWDTETKEAAPLIRGYLSIDGDDILRSDYLTFFDSGSWLSEVPAVSMDIEDWYVDPANSSVSHFEKMVEIEGYYEDPDNEENYFTYYIYLRPWGAKWEDVRTGDTSGCIYSDMMPLYYDDWYVPALDQGVTELPEWE